MLSLWKSGADTARPKTAKPSIRGTISGPIPIPIADDEFPMRQPGTGIATTTKDDEFPIRQRGTGIASPVPPDHLEQPDPPQAAPLAETLLPEPVVPSVETADDSDETLPPPPPQPEPVLAIPVTAASDSPSIAGPGSPTPPQPSTSPQQPRSSPLKTSPPRTSSYSRPSTFPARQTGLPASTITLESNGLSAGQPRKKSALRSAIGRLFGRNKKKNRASHDGGSSARSSATVRPSQNQHHSDPTLLLRTEQQPSAPVPRTASLPVTEYDRPLRSHSIGAKDMMAIESARNSLQGPSPQADLTATPRPRAATLSRPSFHRGEWSGGLAPRPASSRGVMEVDDPDEIGRAITSDSGQGLHRRSRSESGLEDMARAVTRRRSVEIRYWRESYDPGFLSPWSSNAHDDVDRDADGQADSSAPASPVEQPPPQTPPEPFNFGSLTNQMIGMKITQAASIGSRIETLEARSQSLERAVGQLSRAVPGFDWPSAGRSLSNSTVRGLTMCGDAHVETRRTLMEQLDAERAARRALEAQVRKLSDRLNALSATMYAMAGGPSKSRSQEGLAAPPPNLGRPSKSALSSRLSPPSAVPTPAYVPDGPMPKLHADGGEDVDEDDMGESFQTPREEVAPHPYGAFGEDLRANEVGHDDDDDVMDDDPKRTKTARTLSLSQLTLGKGVAQI